LTDWLAVCREAAADGRDVEGDGADVLAGDEWELFGAGLGGGCGGGVYGLPI